MENELKKLDLNKLEAKEGILLIQHQELPKPHLPAHHELQPVLLNGTIKAPANFFTKRTTEIKNDKSHVLYNYRKRTIKLITMEDFYELGSDINGELMINPAIALLCINEEKTFFISDLVKHLRKNKFYFADKDQHKKLIDQVENFTANINTEIKKINTNNGNIENLTKITMKSNAELNFNVSMPVFIGEENKKFNIEVACDASNTSLKFWLESPDLFSLLENDTKNIIDTELARFSEELVFIEQ